MAWIVKTIYKEPHECVLPDLEVERDAGVGSQWECDACGMRFHVINYEGCLLWQANEPHRLAE